MVAETLRKHCMPHSTDERAFEAPAYFAIAGFGKMALS
jgi:hypothetical protein